MSVNLQLGGLGNFSPAILNFSTLRKNENHFQCKLIFYVLYIKQAFQRCITLYFWTALERKWMLQ
jgi:hypothetical protein